MKNKQLLLIGTVALGLLSSYVGAEDTTTPTVTGPFYECTNMTGSIQSATFSVKKKLVLNTVNHSVSTIQGTPAEQSALSGGTLDSNLINTGNVVTTLTGTIPEDITLEEGVLRISPYASVGTYSISIQTCEKENSTNCVLSTVEVIIQAVPVFTGTATATDSQVFFSRTCPEGREPKAETYNANETVTVTGSTQVEADTLAQDLAKKAVQDDITKNGQLFADTYGKCIKKEIPTPPIVELPHTGPSVTLGTGKQEVYTDDTIDFSFETQSGSMYTVFLCNASEEEMKNTHHIDSEAQGLSGVQQFTALTDVCEQVYAESATGSKTELSLSSDDMKNTKILSDVGEKSLHIIKGGCTEREVRCSDFGYEITQTGIQYEENDRYKQYNTQTEKYMDIKSISINEQGGHETPISDLQFREKNRKLRNDFSGIEGETIEYTILNIEKQNNNQKLYALKKTNTYRGKTRYIEGKPYIHIDDFAPLWDNKTNTTLQEEITQPEKKCIIKKFKITFQLYS